MLKVIALLKADIENLYRKYGLMMKNLAKSILGDYQYAEDAVQEALISLSANMDKMDDLDSSRTKNYIYTVTKNKALSIRKKTLEKNRKITCMHCERLGIHGVYLYKRKYNV
jgi:RNA polymerase sigma factor (sigma-70 family)